MMVWLFQELFWIINMFSVHKYNCWKLVATKKHENRKAIQHKWLKNKRKEMMQAIHIVEY